MMIVIGDAKCLAFGDPIWFTVLAFCIRHRLYEGPDLPLPVITPYWLNDNVPHPGHDALQKMCLSRLEKGDMLDREVHNLPALGQGTVSEQSLDDSINDLIANDLLHWFLQ